jgi:hypothetical protein
MINARPDASRCRVSRRATTGRGWYEVDMEDVIAVEVRLKDGSSRFFVTWGRIQDRVDPAPVCELVMRHVSEAMLGGEPLAATVCPTLRVAAESSEAPYFFDALVAFSRQKIPGDRYEEWRREKAEAMANGKELYYCGKPSEDSAGQSPT